MYCRKVVWQRSYRYCLVVFLYICKSVRNCFFHIWKMMDIIFTVNEISIVYFKVNIENEKKNHFGVLFATTGSYADLNKISQTYLHTKVYHSSKFGCSSSCQIWDLLKTRFFVSVPKTDERNSSMKMKVCNYCIFFFMYCTWCILN